MKSTTSKTDYEPMDLEPSSRKKKWSFPLLIGSIVWAAVSFLTPFAVMGLIPCLLYLLASVTLFVICMILRKKNYISISIILSILCIVFNGMILFTHLTTHMITETTW